MESFEPKKLALIRIWQILHKYSDYDHPLTQDDIAEHLKNDYGIIIERKAISRNLSLLKEAGCDIESRRAGTYISARDFEDSELKLLIDGVLQSKYITAKHSADLIEKLSGLSNKYFRSHIRNVYSVNDWSKSENSSLFYNIEIIDAAIEDGKQIQYEYNKFDVDGKLQKSSFQRLSPYHLILHNQRYYIMGYSDYWKHIVFHRVDRITKIKVYDKPLTPLTSVPGYENGIDYKQIATTMPYMYTDKPERIEFVAEEAIIDQIFDWFGKSVTLSKIPDMDGKIKVSIFASPNAMEHWAMQYLNHVEITAPKHLRDRIKEALTQGLVKYN
ncbi:MAG: WYL domain-containing transcriptional regulator [Ruminococcaceae bacterium]|nr:WYL domain-containing transcriptional regulator [Oscillospiraceae bacterium]